VTRARAGIPNDPQDVAVNLYWLPLGAGGHSVRFNGLVYEAAAALLGQRPEGRFVIEQTSVPDNDGAKRGVVAGGAVGTRWAGRLRIFRYELRRWRDGVIPDIAEAVESPQLLTTDPCQAQRVLDLAPSVPTLVWGRDELRAGEMWNSNSFISWLIARSGLDTDLIRPHPPVDERQAGRQASSSPTAASKGEPQGASKAWPSPKPRTAVPSPSASARRNRVLHPRWR
jgi:hypothetical protein